MAYLIRGNTMIFLFLRFRSISWSSYIYGTRKSERYLGNAQRMRNLFYLFRNEPYFIRLYKFSSSKLFFQKKSVTLVFKVLLNFPLLLYFRDMSISNNLPYRN